jgi:hypothetical protein
MKEPTRLRIWGFCLITLALAAGALGQGTDEEGFDQINRRGMEQIDRLNEALQQSGRVFLAVGIVLGVIVGLKILGPVRMIDSVRDRLLRRAVRDVDELLKRIERESETASADAKKNSTEEGLLAGMTEVAEFEQAEQVPSYVLTVNDLMLDSIRVTLKKLRRRKEGDAQRYRDYMFSVIKGMKAITEQSMEADAPSGLAVDIRGYFADSRRYRDWQRLLGRFAKKGEYQEPAGTFLIFMKVLKEGKPLSVSRQAPVPERDVAVPLSKEEPGIPRVLNEETLPAIQQAAARESRSLNSFVQAGKQMDEAWAWQFEFVRRQQQIHLRDEAQRMLSVFLSCERKSLQEVTKVRMLPCRAWGHVLYMLGVESPAQLQKRIEDRLLTIQEIVILEKAFLQTFAKRESLNRIYGHGADAGLMMDMHIPEIRREALALLRKSHETELRHLDRATETLNDEETPQNGQVKKLIEHYVHHGHNPPSMGESGTKEI